MRVRRLLEQLDELVETDRDTREAERRWRAEGGDANFARYLGALVRAGDDLPANILKGIAMSRALEPYARKIGAALKPIVTKLDQTWARAGLAHQSTIRGSKPSSPETAVWQIYPDRDFIVHGAFRVLRFPEGVQETKEGAIKAFRPALEDALQHLQRDPRVGGAWQFYEDEHDPLIDVEQSNGRPVVYLQFDFVRKFDEQMLTQVSGGA